MVFKSGRSIAFAVLGLLLISYGVHADSAEREEQLDVLQKYMANATNLHMDLEPLLDVLKSEIHSFVEMRTDEKSTHKLIQSLLDQIVDEEDDESRATQDNFQSFEAFSGMLDVVGVPQTPEHESRVMASGYGSQLAGAIRGGGAMIPPGTFIAGSPFIGLRDEPLIEPPTWTSEGFRAIPEALQNKFNEFYAEFCLQAGINDDAGQYNFPGFDLGEIEIEVSKGGCIVEKHSGQLLCDSGFISYNKKPASLNGFSKTGVEYEGSYCPGLVFPKKVELKKEASVGGVTHTVFRK